MTAIPIITTDRLTMRGPEAEDFALFREFYATAEGSGHYGGPLRADQAFLRLAEDMGHWQLRGFGRWIVTVTDTGEAVGGCGLWHPVGWPSHELTWWLMPRHRGKGFATEASRAVIRHACDALRWSHVETHTRDENGPALKLVARLGGEKIRREEFPDGVTRDVFRMQPE